MNHKKTFLSFIFCSLILILLIPIFGRTLEYEGLVFWSIRVPRVLTCVMAGGALSLGGLVFQAIFRNDLATPYTLGVASGASLGATIAIVFGFSYTFLYWGGITLFAFIGALGISSLIFLMSYLNRKFDTATLLLAGVAMGMICSSLILFLNFLGTETDNTQIIRWLMGGVNVVGMETPISLMPFVLIISLTIWFFSGELNLLSFGENFSQSRGIDPSKTRKKLFVLISLMLAPVVAECGPIGFIGLVIPHFVKRIMHHDHRYLIPASFIGGGLLLALCDLIARTVIDNSILPTGIITALCGGPFFIWILFRRRAH